MSYDSDSDDDYAAAGVTETNVLLGYTQEDDDVVDNAPDARDADNDSQPDTVSRLGGRPDWLTTTTTSEGDGGAEVRPDPALLRCGACRAPMVLLLQLDGALPTRFPGHVRRLYVLACRRAGCRRRAGCIRVVRGVRVDAAQKAEKAEEKPVEKAVEKAAPPLGETLFGAKPFAGGAANPFGNPFGGGSGSGGSGGNPFQLGGSAAAPAAAKEAPAAPTPPPAKDDLPNLPQTFAAALTLNKDDADKGDAPATTSKTPEPWPQDADWPAPYPVRWITDAEYETLEPVPTPTVPQTTMEIDDGPAPAPGKEDKFVFESSMDAAFQAFADRVAQNPEQVLRYEFGGEPLLYSRDDGVAEVVKKGLPACPRCRSARAFEAQLMPHAIARLEADEPGLDGMDWGTVVVGVCSKDCGGRDGPEYVEEWAGVQWEK